VSHPPAGQILQPSLTGATMTELDKVILLHIRLARIQLSKDKWEDAMQNMFKARELRGRR
jgi:predicted negative regulator of RcsB-dependent stress response